MLTNAEKQTPPYIPDVHVLVVSDLSRNLRTYINLVSDSIPLNDKAWLKRVSGLRDDSVHTVKRQEGGSLRSCEPYRSICLFLIYK